jgi:hypothetical protein
VSAARLERRRDGGVAAAAGADLKAVASRRPSEVQLLVLSSGFLGTVFASAVRGFGFLIFSFVSVENP